MANLNLSEFTEKLFVADADHTFIWDSAASISKRVSRNSWLNSGTLTSDAPVTISQTWNQIGTAFTAFKVNAVSTASASGSLLADFQLGTVSKLKVDKNGGLISSSGSLSGLFLSSGTDGMEVVGGALFAFSSSNIVATINRSAVKGFSTTWDGAFAFGTSNTNANVSGADTILLRDAANTLALRNGAAAQTFNVYGTWTTAITNFERLAIKYNTTDVAYQIAAEKGTTNGDYRPLQLWTGGASRLHVTTAGNVGIGTTAPGAKLEVVENTSNLAALIVRSSSVAAPRIEFIDGAVTPNRWTFGIGATSTTDGLFALYDARLNAVRLAINASGNVGIGTTSPTSKLQVSAGDVEVDTIAKGVILKSPDGTRYRVTVANGGTLSVAAV